jgi:hypothetical protein
VADTKNYEYNGPFNPLVVEGKAYAPGDTIPLTEDVLRILTANGHRFTDVQTGQDAKRPSRDVNDPVLVKAVIDAGLEPTGLSEAKPVVEADAKPKRTRTRTKRTSTATAGAGGPASGTQTPDAPVTP